MALVWHPCAKTVSNNITFPYKYRKFEIFNAQLSPMKKFRPFLDYRMTGKVENFKTELQNRSLQSPSWINGTSAEKTSYAKITTLFAFPKNTLWIRFLSHINVHDLNHFTTQIKKKILKNNTFGYKCWKLEHFSPCTVNYYFSMLLSLVGKSRPFPRSRMTGKVYSFTTE